MGLKVRQSLSGSKISGVVSTGSNGDYHIMPDKKRPLGTPFLTKLLRVRASVGRSQIESKIDFRKLSACARCNPLCFSKVPGTFRGAMRFTSKIQRALNAQFK